jgi:hypothetical protein
MEWNIRQAGISQMAFILINMFRYRIGLDVKYQCDEIVFGQLTPLARFVHEDAQFAQMGSWQRWRKRNAGEYPPATWSLALAGQSTACYAKKRDDSQHPHECCY